MKKAADEVRQRPEKRMSADGSVAASAAGAGTAVGTAAAAGAGEGDLRSDDEAHGAGVESSAADGVPQFLHAAEGVAVLLDNEIGFVGIIEGKADAGTAAAAGGEVHADAGLGLVSEESVELFASVFSKRKHRVLHKEREVRSPL